MLLILLPHIGLKCFFFSFIITTLRKKLLPVKDFLLYSVAMNYFIKLTHDLYNSAETKYKK